MSSDLLEVLGWTRLGSEVETEGGSDMVESNAIVALEYNGTVIRDRDEMLCLTDMWRAAGAPPKKRPRDWKVTQQGGAFVEETARKLEGPVAAFYVTSKGGGRGAGGSTWAHWQIGLAYAQYLSIDFHHWCNDAVKEKMERLAKPAPHAPTQLGTVGDVLLQLIPVVVSECMKQVEARLQRQTEINVCLGHDGGALDDDYDSELGSQIADAVEEVRRAYPTNDRRRIRWEVETRLRKQLDYRREEKGNTWRRFPSSRVVEVGPLLSGIVRDMTWAVTARPSPLDPRPRPVQTRIKFGAYDAYKARKAG